MRKQRRPGATPMPIVYQLNDWSCGAAAALMARMVLGENDAILQTSQVQQKVWEATQTLPGKLLYTVQPRLAEYLMQFGYRTTLLCTYSEGFRWVPGEGLDEQDFVFRMKHYRRHLDNAVRSGLQVEVGSFTSADLAQRLDESTVAIVFTALGRGVRSQYFHHRLVRGLDAPDVFDVLDPMVGPTSFYFEEFDELMNVPFGQNALLVRRA